MRATDVVRQVLDLLDEIEGTHDTQVDNESSCGCEDEYSSDAEQGEPIAGRFKQIFAMLDAPKSELYANTPNEVVAPIEAVTTLAGGGVNGPKHPDDIRVKDPRGYE
jgi:hypothetical protein